MRIAAGTISRTIVTLGLTVLVSGSARAQATARSTVIIPLKKEKAAASKVVTIHDTVTMVRVDTVRIVQTVAHTDTLFRVDTLRDSCSRAGAFPLPVPIPIPIGHHTNGPPPTIDPPPVTSVAPEPETFVLLGTALGVLGIVRFRRRK